MALHMIRSAPNFTKAMRGYDIEEVDEYVEALRESEDEHAAVLQEAESRTRQMSGELERLRQRVAQLEECIRSETPRSIAALGERLTLMLEEAEAGAQEALRAAREEADATVASAQAAAEEQRLMSVARTAEADQRASARLAAAEEQAARLEATSRAMSETILADAEQRVLARRTEIEAWVERVRTHIETEEARAAEEFARVRAIRAADLADLRRRHDQMVAGLLEIGASIRRTVDIAQASVPAEPAPFIDPDAQIADGDETTGLGAEALASADLGAEEETDGDAVVDLEEPGATTDVSGGELHLDLAAEESGAADDPTAETHAAPLDRMFD